ncbi:TPA: PP2C family protein-serine/threonine phosphatase [Serratia fonticola]
MNNFFEKIQTSLSSTINIDLFFEVWGTSRNIASTNKIDGIGVSLGTHPGLKRTRNEDRLVSALITSGNGRDYFIAILCDGVGGTECGDIAASLTISSIIYEIIQEKVDRALNEILCDSIKKTDKIVSDILIGKGATTACVFLASTSEMSAVSVGDSRIFSWDHRNKIISQVSEDDTLENELRKINKNDMSALNAYGLRGHLSQAIGEITRSPDDLKLNVIPHTELLNGYGLILASDGAWKDTDICFDKVIINAPSAQDAVRRVLATATWCGGSDNTSILAIDNLKDIENLLVNYNISAKDKFPKVSLWQVDKKTIIRFRIESFTHVNSAEAMSLNEKKEPTEKVIAKKSPLLKKQTIKNKTKTNIKDEQSINSSTLENKNRQDHYKTKSLNKNADEDSNDKKLSQFEKNHNNIQVFSDEDYYDNHEKDISTQLNPSIKKQIIARVDLIKKDLSSSEKDSSSNEPSSNSKVSGNNNE